VGPARRRTIPVEVVGHGGVPDRPRPHRLRTRVDFGPAGEGYVRFCFARERKELLGALEEMRTLFAEG